MTPIRTAVHWALGVGHGIAGSVYGTIVVMAVIAGADRGSETHVGRLALFVGVTAGVLYLAHVYAHALGESVIRGAPVTRAHVTAVATRESSIILAATPPVVALLLGAIGVIRPVASIWLALGLGVGMLAAQGLRYARLERLTRHARRRRRQHGARALPDRAQGVTRALSLPRHRRPHRRDPRRRGRRGRRPPTRRVASTPCGGRPRE